MQKFQREAQSGYGCVVVFEYQSSIFAYIDAEFVQRSLVVTHGGLHGDDNRLESVENLDGER